MIGHGRPSSSASALARAAIVLCACMAGHADAQNAPVSEPVQLRISWSGVEPARWFGSVAVTDGSLTNLALLGPEPDGPGSFWLEDGRLRVATLSAHKSDCIVLTVDANPAARLTIELSTNEKSAGQPIEVPLADVLRRSFETRLDERGSKFEIQVVPQPNLRMTANRDPLIFAPCETCSFELSTAIANLVPGTELEVTTTLTLPDRKDSLLPARSDRVAVPVDGHPKIALEVPLPKAEGVYTIHVAATRPSGFVRVWSSSAKLAERSFQVVVLDPKPSAQAPAARWESVLEIDPTNPRWIERLQLDRIPGLNHGSLGSMHARAVDLPLGRFIELPPPAPGADPHWQAYSLPLEAVGAPHMLEIEYPADAEQHIGVSIVEPDAAGILRGINRDAGIYVEGLGRSETKQKQTARLVFWPRTQAPLLVMTNLHPSAAAHFGHVRVLKCTTNRLATGPATDRLPHERMVAAYLARPTVIESLGVSRPVATTTAAVRAVDSMDNADTAYLAASRLADYLQFSGYNAAILSIAPDAQSPSTATKSLRIDSNDLMLRVFDREGISLIPALDFSAPLSQLEVLRRTNDAHTSGLEWVGRDGRTWLQTYGTRGGRAPYYNLLDPRVQQSILQTAHEAITRYGRHSSLAGLAIQLSSDGFAQLPPIDWGLDDATIARFERDSGIQLTKAAGDERFPARHAQLTGQHADAWRSWRAAQVTAFYGQLASLVQNSNGRRLILTTENLLAHPQVAARVRPNLLDDNAENTLALTMFEAGIDRKSLERVPGLVLCPTRFVEPINSLPDCAADLIQNDAFDVWRRATNSTQPVAAMLYHRPLRQRLASFETARTPWRVDGQMQLIAQSLPQSSAIRQPYLDGLLANDPAIFIDGGELLPLGQEDTLREVRSILAQLPNSARVSDVAKQPIVLRTYSEANRVTLVAMNLSPWRCDLRTTMELGQSATLEPFTGDTITDTLSARTVTLAAGRQEWPLSLGPYEMRAVRTTTTNLKVVDVQAEVGESAKTELAAMLTELDHRDLSAPRVYPALANPSFEPTADPGQIPGWHLTGNREGAFAQLLSASPQDGQTCLYMRGGGRGAAIESEVFPAPPTGQLAMTVYARGRSIGPETNLRLVFESVRGGLPYQRAALVSAEKLQATGGQWGLFAILVNDLPLESRGQMRITFELTGPGEVWLDNAVLYDVLFPLKFYGNAQAEILQLNKQIYAARSALETKQITDCVRLLDGYWPRFILAYRPPVQPKLAGGNGIDGQPPSPPQANERQEPAAGISEHIKRARARFLPILR
jgi:hypothetical protein